jgi:hypothetical protein
MGFGLVQKTDSLVCYTRLSSPACLCHVTMAYGIRCIAIRPGPRAELALGTLKEEHMRIYRYVGSFLLAAALIAPREC